MHSNTMRPPRRRGLRRCVAAAAMTCVALGSWGGIASAEFGVRPSPTDPSRPDLLADVFRADGTTPETQAGAAPDHATTVFFLNRLPGDTIPDGHVKDLVVDLPPGLVGNPEALPLCDRPTFNGPSFNDTPCPANTQIGVVEATVRDNSNNASVYTVPVYNVVPAEGQVAHFGFRILTTTLHIRASVRPGDYGIRATLSNMPETLPILGARLRLWGVPADPSHDPQRKQFCVGTEADPRSGFCSPGGASSNAPLRAFWRNPTFCGPPLTTRFSFVSWENPAASKDYGVPTATGPTGCDQLPFEPTIRITPGTTAAGKPTALRVDLGVPQNETATGLATAHLRKAVVRLPEGLSVSPSSAGGLGACTDEQIGLGQDRADTCPESSRIGTVQIDTPVLGEPLRGSIILGTQTPSQLLRLFLVAEGQGVRVKLPGKVDPDPVTGQLTATFDDNPQLPFDNLTLQFKGGERAPLVNPATCGVKTTTTEMTSWGGQVRSPSDSYTVTHDGNGAPCPPQGFAPSFVAGSETIVGGGDTAFSLTFARNDADQALQSIAVDLPQGLLARIASVPLCGEAQAAAGTCGEESRVGSATTVAGPGGSPYTLPGRVYMGGPYKGAPFNLSIVVPAVAGPFDLGTVVVRAPIYVDRRTTALRIVSDPLPTILKGIPLHIRSVNVRVDRPGFMFNPTSCSAKRVSASISSYGGASAARESRFQATGCPTLPFRPKMTLSVGRRGHTSAGKTTPLRVALTMTPGQANNRVVDVTLPRALNSRLSVVSNRNACTPEQFAAQRCPQSIGTSVAVTPLLREPLRGNVYLVRSTERRLPDMVVALRGQVDVDLVGKISIVPGALTVKTSFDTVPDVPITRFSLNLVDGRRGAIGAVRNLCQASTRRGAIAKLAFRGHNGRAARVNQTIKVAGCGKASQRGGGRRAARRGGRRGSSNRGRGGRRR